MRESLWLGFHFLDINLPAHYFSPHQILRESPLLGISSIYLEVSRNRVNFAPY